MLRSTRTYVKLPVPALFYMLVKAKLQAAGYGQAIHSYDGEEVLDMDGIALEATPDVDTGERVTDDQLAAWADLAMEVSEATGGPWTVTLGVKEDATADEVKAALCSLLGETGPYHHVGVVKEDAAIMKVAAVTSGTSLGRALASYLGWSQPNNVVLLIREVLRERQAKRGFSCGPLEIGLGAITLKQVADLVVQIATPILEAVEHGDRKVGNGHHVAQRIAEGVEAKMRQDILRGMDDSVDNPQDIGDAREGGDVDSDDGPQLH